MKRYPIVTLCGSTRFRKEFEEVQKELTLDGYIVISVGFFENPEDSKGQDGKDARSLPETKKMLGDIHKSKIDMADEIFVVNPLGYIGENTWSEICYARMIGKAIRSLEPINEESIRTHVIKHILLAEKLAAHQYDVYVHTAADYPGDALLQDMVTIRHKKVITVDPWVPEDEFVPRVNEPYLDHGDKNQGYDPFVIYGRKKMARFIETIVMKHKMEHEGNLAMKRDKLMAEIEWYCNALKMPLPSNYPDDMSDEEMQDFVACWREFDPCPEGK